MTKFKVGDVVHLLSGSPKMTVIDDGPTDGFIYCQWFDNNGTVHGQEFPEAALVKVG